MSHTRGHYSPSFFSRSRLLLSVFGLLLVYVLAACGSGGATGTAVPSQGASTGTAAPQGNQATPAAIVPVSCSRISDATVSESIGIQIDPPIIASQYSTPVGASTTCIYHDAATTQIQEVAINYYSGPSASQAFNNISQKSVASDLQPVSGLGDKAIFDTRRFVLHVLKDNLYIYISLVKLRDQGATKLLADARQIATAILAGS